MKFPNDSEGGCIDKGYLRGEKATRGNFNFKGGVQTLPETMVYFLVQFVIWYMYFIYLLQPKLKYIV